MEEIAEGLVRVIAALLAWLVELTIGLAALAWKPLKYLLSSNYRLETQARWANDSLRCGFEMVGGALVLAAFAGLMVWWVSVLIPKSKSEPRPEPTPAPLRGAAMRKLRETLQKRNPTHE